MNSLIKTFIYQSHNMRTALVNSDFYFNLKDACEILEINDHKQAKERLNNMGCIIYPLIDSLGRQQKATFINTKNLFRLIFQSKKADAIKFQDFVCDDVLPSIMKTGGYIADPELQKIFEELGGKIKVLRMIADNHLKNKLKHSPKMTIRKLNKLKNLMTVEREKISTNDMASIIKMSGSNVREWIKDIEIDNKVRGLLENNNKEETA